MDAVAKVRIELPEMDTSKEVHVQDGEEHVTRNSMVSSQYKISVKFDCTMYAAAEVRIELPEMDTGKEVHVQDGEEHVICNSTAASEMNEDVGIEKQGEESEEGMSPAAGASYLHPLVLDESESDDEYQTWINHLSSSPEGLWLHVLCFHLAGAVFDGFETREFFGSRVLPWSKGCKVFKAPAAALAEPEEEFEETHWQSMGDMQMPSGEENQDDDSNGEQSQQQIPQQMPQGITLRDVISRVDLYSETFKMPDAALDEYEEFEEMHRQSMSDMQIMPLNSREGNQHDNSNGEQSQQQIPQQMPQGITLQDVINRGRRCSQALKMPAAALAESEKEFEEMQQQSMSDMQIMPLNSREGNQHDVSNGEQLQQQIPQQMPQGITLRDVLNIGRRCSQAFKMPAAALAESEEFEEMHRQSMSDMQIMPLNSREGNQDDNSNGEQLQQQIPQQMPQGITLHDVLNRSRRCSQAFKMPAAALAEPEKEFEEMQQQSMSDMQLPPRVGNQGAGSNGEQLQQQIPQQIPQQMPNNARKKRRVAAKKTAANADGPSNLQGPNSTQTSRPRPLHIGVQKNTPAKKNKGYLKNRLQ